MVFRPPTADKLFDRIAAEVNDGTAEKLHDADDDIASFLTRFPNDARVAQVKSYKGQIEQVQFEKHCGQAKQRLQSQDTPPVQRDYLEAMALAESNPHGAIQRLQALVDVYHDSTGNDEATQHTLDLAAKDLHRLQAGSIAIRPSGLRFADCSNGPTSFAAAIPKSERNLAWQ